VNVFRVGSLERGGIIRDGASHQPYGYVEFVHDGIFSTGSLDLGEFVGTIDDRRRRLYAAQHDQSFVRRERAIFRETSRPRLTRSATDQERRAGKLLREYTHDCTIGRVFFYKINVFFCRFLPLIPVHLRTTLWKCVKEFFFRNTGSSVSVKLASSVGPSIWS
jgi:hypothetical protein